jgi:pimeloyl-ACP methyl ester carboxylesterase
MKAIGALICLGLSLIGCGASASQPRDSRFQAQVRRTPETEIAWYARGEGPPLVMLIGTGSTMAEWDPALLRRLAETHRLIMFDYPGVGRSGPWRGDSFDSLADTTAAFMREIGVDRADVLGWSMGGFVAQRLAIGHPEVVSHLILAGTNPGGSETDLGPPSAQDLDSDPDPSDQAILEELYPPNRQDEGRRFLKRLVRASQSGEIPDDFEVSDRTVNRQVEAEDPWLRSDRNYRQLATLAIPTLAAGGREDIVVPPINLERIARRVPGSTLRLFPGAHAFLFQERKAFTEAVNELSGD